MKVIKTADIEGLELRIKEARLRFCEDNSVTVTWVAAQAGMTASNWYRIESGVPSVALETLRKMEAVLNADFGVSV